MGTNNDRYKKSVAAGLVAMTQARYFLGTPRTESPSALTVAGLRAELASVHELWNLINIAVDNRPLCSLLSPPSVSHRDWNPTGGAGQDVTYSCSRPGCLSRTDIREGDLLLIFATSRVQARQSAGCTQGPRFR